MHKPTCIAALKHRVWLWNTSRDSCGMGRASWGGLLLLILSTCCYWTRMEWQKPESHGVWPVLSRNTWSSFHCCTQIKMQLNKKGWGRSAVRGDLWFGALLIDLHCERARVGLSKEQNICQAIGSLPIDFRPYGTVANTPNGQGISAGWGSCPSPLAGGQFCDEAD